MSEVLFTFFSLVNRDGEIDFLNVGGNFAEVDFNFFVVAFARARQVIAHMFDCAAFMLEIAVENKIVITCNFAACAKQEN